MMFQGLWRCKMLANVASLSKISCLWPLTMAFHLHGPNLLLRFHGVLVDYVYQHCESMRQVLNLCCHKCCKSFSIISFLWTPLWSCDLMWHIFLFFNYNLMVNKRVRKISRQGSKECLMHLACQAMQKSM
jgi:hypothetical protein